MDHVASEATRRLITRLAIASIVPVGMLVVAMAMKPMWRDEFWSLYFSEPRFSLGELLADRMRYETHPPLYFTFLRMWREFGDSDTWIRALALPFLAVGFLGAWQLGRGRKELALFLLMCIGSYWVIYYVTEARPYTLLFMLCAWLTLIYARMLEDRPLSPIWYGLFVLVGAAASLSHYFGALWVGCAGLATGIAMLMRGRPGALFAIGVASIMAVAPLVYWLVISYPMLGERGGNPPPDSEEWMTFLNQLQRGLTVKLLGSNLALTCLFFAGVAALWRRKDTLDRVILWSTLLFIALSAALDLFYSPMIKERSFTPMIPALILLMSRAVLSVDPERKWAKRFMVAAPIVAAVSPFLFVPEYFKDREKLGEFRALMAREGEACSGATIPAFMRERWNDDAYQREVIDRQLRQALPEGVAPPRVISAARATGPVEPHPGCRVRAFALTMKPGGAEESTDARAALMRIGIDVAQLEELRFGKGRTLLWVEGERPLAPNGPAQAPTEAPAAEPQ